MRIYTLRTRMILTIQVYVPLHALQFPPESRVYSSSSFVASFCIFQLLYYSIYVLVLQFNFPVPFDCLVVCVCQTLSKNLSICISSLLFFTLFDLLVQEAMNICLYFYYASL